MRKILHITPHLGGGVGKALSTLIKQASTDLTERHEVLCLEEPQKRQAIEVIEAAGCVVNVQPDISQVKADAAEADIVQIEFWNHPEIPRILCALESVPMRLLAWCHISGLNSPCIPLGLLNSSTHVVFTSPCSLLSDSVQQSNKVFSVVSSGCVDGLPLRPEKNNRQRLRVGYVGTLDFVKLHPDIVEIVAGFPEAALPLHLYGDLTNQATLEAQCAAIGRSDLLCFHGHVADIAAELANLDIFAYPLNPLHYGTAENALLEAMAMGVVPVVLDNPAEKVIVKNGKTGFVTKDKYSFQSAIYKLAEQTNLGDMMAANAIKDIRTDFTAMKMLMGLREQYDVLMQQEKTIIEFQNIFGKTPSSWFASFQLNGIPDSRLLSLNSTNKGSLRHFLAKFPENFSLKN
ncbi:MAG: glycosyltransferase [Methylovulum sp.]|nr:glycosyltransferase [Methylovulum sp.]MCF7997777.1 glycosyltransferase [Methylovulum sp.]